MAIWREQLSNKITILINPLAAAGGLFYASLWTFFVKRYAEFFYRRIHADCVAWKREFILFFLLFSSFQPPKTTAFSRRKTRFPMRKCWTSVASLDIDMDGIWFLKKYGELGKVWYNEGSCGYRIAAIMYPSQGWDWGPTPHTRTKTSCFGIFPPSLVQRCASVGENTNLERFGNNASQEAVCLRLNLYDKYKFNLRF